MTTVHGAYTCLAEVSGRVRDLSEIEKRNPLVGDMKEATGVAQLYLNGLKLTANALQEGKFEDFDAVTGDHGCHRTALIALRARNEVCGELQALQLPQQVHIKKSGNSPKELIEKNGYAFQVSSTTRYLVEAAILKLGTNCIEHADGTMTLTVDAQKISNKAKGPDIAIMNKLIVALKESMNQFAVCYVQSLAPSLFSRVVVASTPRGNFQFISAFHDMNTVIKNLSELGVHFLITPYDRNQPIKEPFLVFDSKGKKLDNPKLTGPVFVIQGFGNPEIVTERGLFDFIRSNIATAPQLETEDGELTEEVIRYRAEGKELMQRFRIAHTYATTLGNR